MKIKKTKINKKQNIELLLFESFLIAFQLYMKNDNNEPRSPKTIVSVPIKKLGFEVIIPNIFPPIPEKSPTTSN
jgi:hypothetical protein